MSSVAEQKKRKQKNNTSKSTSGPSGLSLERKLGWALWARIFSILLATDILVLVLFSAGILYHGEQEMAYMLDQSQTSNGSSSLLSVSQEESVETSLSLPSFCHDHSPLASREVQRKFSLDTSEGSGLPSLIYEVYVPEEKQLFSFAYGRALSLWSTPFYILLLFQALMLISSAFYARRRVRHILAPITEMSRQVKTLSQPPGETASAADLENLRIWAGALSSIDAGRLDKRLSVDETQSELKDLADAINRMLDRIDESYHSQVRFVSDASHELRTPIAVIQGYINLLDRWGKNDQAAMQEAIDAIKGESENMKNLIEQLLFLARGDSETLRLTLETFDSVQVLQEVVREAEMIDKEHPFHLEEGAPAYIRADRQLMKQALRILVDNSIKYTPPGGAVTLSVTGEKGSVRITIQDQGIGIPPENLPLIFERFYRSEESRARKTGGAGLGLAIMKWIVERHGGVIEVLSREQIGTRTSILLPEADPPVE